MHCTGDGGWSFCLGVKAGWARRRFIARPHRDKQAFTHSFPTDGSQLASCERKTDRSSIEQN